MIRTIVSALLALSFMVGAAGVAMAVAENDNDRSTRNAKEFYEKLDQQGGSGN